MFIEDQKDWDAVIARPGMLDQALTEAFRIGLHQDDWPEFALLYLLGA
jgi:hypothetical protein